MLCQSLLKNGMPCRYKAKYGDFCGVHKSRQFVLPPPNLEKPDDCIICFNLLNAGDNDKISCGHYVHHDCIRKWTKAQKLSHHTCPLCKKTITLPPPPPLSMTIKPPLFTFQHQIKNNEVHSISFRRGTTIMEQHEIMFLILTDQ